MSSETEEIIRICEALPQDKLAEVADFARFLLSQRASPQIRSPRLVHPEQAADFRKQVVEIPADAQL